MLNFINENSELKNRKFPLAKGIRRYLQQVLKNYDGDKSVMGYKRLNNILEMDAISFSEMKRIKNFFDSYTGTDKSAEYILNGGDAMKTWVNNTLNTARQAVENFKQAKKDAGIKNAFIRHHEKERQVRKDKPTQVKFKTSNLNKKIGDNNNLRFESRNVVCLSEAQVRFLIEAQDDSFSFKELSNITSFRGRYNYCVQHLGKPIGKGSSRAVFQISDEKVLKLAYNEKGIAQNCAECDYYLDSQGIIPHLFEKDPDDKWLVSEFVLPSKQSDFKETLGISFKDFIKFIVTCFANRSPKKQYFSGYILDDETFEKCCENEDLYAFDNYIGDYDPPQGDLLALRNYGLTMRDGYPTIVLLDSGLTDQIWNEYYKR